MKRSLSIFLLFIMIFMLTIPVFAKSSSSSSSGSRSSSSSKSSSSGFKSSSSIKSSTSSTSSNKSTSSTKSTTTSPSTSATSPSKSSATTPNTITSSSTSKATSSGFKSAKMSEPIKMTPTQKSSYKAAIKTPYTAPKVATSYKAAITQRPARIAVITQRPVVVALNPMYSSISYGYGYCGIWDLWYLSRASDLFWYHHWAELSMYNSYFDNQAWMTRQAKIEEMKAKGTPADPKYIDPDADPDLQYSEEYVNEHKKEIYQSVEDDSPFWPIFWTTLILGSIICGSMYWYRKRY